MVFKTVCLAAMAASAAAFAPAHGPSVQSVALRADMSESIPFLPRPEKLDGSMAGDMGFDPMGLSEIQQDLTYARWAELKHGRICMLALTGMVIQEAGIHLAGDQFTALNPFEAPAKVGFVGNMQVFLTIGIIELANFNRHYDGSEPGDLGWTGGLLDNMDEEQIKYRKEQEIVHCRLAMIAFTGATVQTLLFNEKLLGGAF
mmetsp:Transcript_36196/g.73915  ORF Transcript_36196/g.73915 Transcript_36196/m.73915 type:complete len:202 (-) Transcript_36196:235-840(-)